jgi:hypothetical protein
MTKIYRIQGEHRRTSRLDHHCLCLALSSGDIEAINRRLMYARHRRYPKLLQFDQPIKAHVHFRNGNKFLVDHCVLNIDECSRLFFTTRDPNRDIETIKFHFEELTFPWMVGLDSHTICVSRHFWSDFGSEAELALWYPRTSNVLWTRYEELARQSARGPFFAVPLGNEE